MFVNDKLNNVPPDWEDPVWDTKDRVHNWRNYVDDEVKRLWPLFTDEAKQALAQNFNGIAEIEHLD